MPGVQQNIPNSEPSIVIFEEVAILTIHIPETRLEIASVHTYREWRAPAAVCVPISWMRPNIYTGEQCDELGGMRVALNMSKSGTRAEILKHIKTRTQGKDLTFANSLDAPEHLAR